MTVRAPPTLNTTAPLHGFGPPSVGRDPYGQSPPQQRQSCSWMDRHGRVTSPPEPVGDYTSRNYGRKDLRTVDLLIEPGQSLGLMIRGGVEYGLGIFITGVDKESVADRAGLMVSCPIFLHARRSHPPCGHSLDVSNLRVLINVSLWLGLT